MKDTLFSGTSLKVDESCQGFDCDAPLLFRAKGIFVLKKTRSSQLKCQQDLQYIHIPAGELCILHAYMLRSPTSFVGR